MSMMSALLRLPSHVPLIVNILFSDFIPLLGYRCSIRNSHLSYLAANVKRICYQWHEFIILVIYDYSLRLNFAELH